MVWPEVCPEVDPLFDPAVEEEAPAAVPPPAAVPVCSEAIITPFWWSEREVGPGGVGFGAGFVFGAALVHCSESLVALVTLNCFMLEVLAELPPALAVAEPFAPGAELAEAWPVGPDAVAVLPDELIPAPALFAVLALAAAPSVPVT